MSVFSMTYTPGTNISNATFENYSSGEIGVNGTNTTIDIPEAGTQTFNLSGIQMTMVILIAILAVSIVAGVRVLGTGLSDTSQAMIFNSGIYLGLWGVFSVLAYSLIDDMSTFGWLIWLALTIMLVIGVAQQTIGGSVGGD